MNLPVPASSGPLVVRSAASPVALGGAFAGFLVALLAGASFPLLVVLVVLGWGAGIGATVGLRSITGTSPSADRIDPFAVGEPWRHFVKGALTARNRFEESLRSARPGPLKDRLTEIGASIDTGVRECWEVSKQAQTVAQARKAIDLPGLRRRLESLEERDADTSTTESSIHSQIASAERLDAVLAEVTDRLELLEAQLTEAVTRAIEVAALAGHDDELAGVGTSIEQVVDNLEALRIAMAETGGGGSTPSGFDELPPGDQPSP
ncbi:MAG: hypothetical protein ACXIVQ_05575 [Acidimicrobiales bacterium]